jgi:hypothetical protein
MDRFNNSIALAKASWRVLRDDKQLAVLPLLSSVATILVILTFLVPIALVSHDGSSGGGWTAKPVDWVLGFVGYFAVTYVVVFFNAALVWAADRRLQGQTVTLGEAIHAAKDRAHVLLPWVLVSASVSLVLRAIEQRGGMIAQIVASIAGLAWSLVTFLVLPILVIEGIGVGDAVRRSTDLFKRTWGENMIANAGIGLIAFVAVFAGALPLFLFLAMGGPIAIFGVVLFVAWVVAVSLVSATLTGILQVALYRFATQGSVPGFTADELNGAFRPRRNRGSTFGF